MELLNTIQDKIWICVFSFFYTDCVPMIFIAISGLLAILFFIFRKKILHRTYAFGLVELPVLLSIHYVTIHLPRLHNRIHLALNTTAGIILQSSDYLKEFQSISGIQKVTNQSIARYLYYLNDTNVFSDVVPKQLYYHFFKTLKETRGFWGFLEVQKKSMVLTVFLILFLFCAIIYDLQKRAYFHMFLLSLLILFVFIFENGILLSIFIFLFLEYVFAQMFPSS